MASPDAYRLRWDSWASDICLHPPSTVLAAEVAPASRVTALVPLTLGEIPHVFAKLLTDTPSDVGEPSLHQTRYDHCAYS
jgi:hypothetical protein